jgi:NAD(P)-dependent dehydrogenase (short-subunit alcohol dehydrogenase family)
VSSEGPGSGSGRAPPEVTASTWTPGVGATTLDPESISVPPGLPEPIGAPSARRFSDRVAVVTGAGSGIGRAVALRLAAEGASVVAADIDLAAARETVSMTERRRRHLAARIDVRSARSVEALAGRVAARFGRLDVLVNNAGIEILGSVLEMDPATWDEVIAVNLRGTYLASRAFLPLLLAGAGEGRDAAIVNNASLMGLVSSRRLSAYCASKAGVVSLTRSMALDYADAGIRVNCVCPGIIHTPMLERRFALEPDRAAAYRRTVLRPPVHYLGRPEDVAAAIAYLASDEARFVTGSAVTIDGGVSAE